MTSYKSFTNDQRWKLLKPMLSNAKRRHKGGRFSTDNLKVLEGIFRVFHSGVHWQDFTD